MDVFKDGSGPARLRKVIPDFDQGLIERDSAAPWEAQALLSVWLLNI